MGNGMKQMMKKSKKKVQSKLKESLGRMGAARPIFSSTLLSTADDNIICEYNLVRLLDISSS
jgi:hypothetical protein